MKKHTKAELYDRMALFSMLSWYDGHTHYVHEMEKGLLLRRFAVDVGRRVRLLHTAEMGGLVVGYGNPMVVDTFVVGMRECGNDRFLIRVGGLWSLLLGRRMIGGVKES